MIFGLVGYIGAGKDTAAKYFIEEAGCRPDSFASSLKDVCTAIFGWPRELMEGQTAESRLFRETVDVWWSTKLGIPNFTPRLAMQLVGTDTIRNHFNADMWLLTLQKRYDEARGDVIITDARFPNEINFIRKLGGKIIFVDNGTYPDWKPFAESANAGSELAIDLMNHDYPEVHYSEWAWAGTELDEVLYNTGSLESLKKNVIALHTKLDLSNRAKLTHI